MDERAAERLGEELADQVEKLFDLAFPRRHDQSEEGQQARRQVAYALACSFGASMGIIIKKDGRAAFDLAEASATKILDIACRRMSGATSNLEARAELDKAAGRLQ